MYEKLCRNCVFYDVTGEKCSFYNTKTAKCMLGQYPNDGSACDNHVYSSITDALTYDFNVPGIKSSCIDCKFYDKDVGICANGYELPNPKETFCSDYEPNKDRKDYEELDVYVDPRSHYIRPFRTNEKVKVFTAYLPDGIEKYVNEWLAENQDKICSIEKIDLSINQIDQYHAIYFGYVWYTTKY